MAKGFATGFDICKNIVAHHLIENYKDATDGKIKNSSWQEDGEVYEHFGLPDRCLRVDSPRGMASKKLEPDVVWAMISKSNQLCTIIGHGSFAQSLYAAFEKSEIYSVRETISSDPWTVT